jgi:hypothetical protein
MVSNKTTEQKETGVEYSTPIQLSMLSDLPVHEFVREFIVYVQSHNNTFETEVHTVDLCTSLSCSITAIS